MENQNNISFYEKENEKGEMILRSVRLQAPQKIICIPNTFKHIGENAFIFVSHIEEVILPDGIQTIGIGAFKRYIEKDRLKRLFFQIVLLTLLIVLLNIVTDLKILNYQKI